MSGVRRQDTTRGPPLRVLSLDGGGVRGYSMLILLQELMHRTFVEIHGTAPKKHEIPKPCDHFDLIAGTGTGGLIAIMLGRLRLDLETCKEVYVRMTRRVFETDKTIAGIPYRSTLFKASKLEDAIRDCVREHTVFEDEGNDSLATAQDLRTPLTPDTPTSAFSPSTVGPQRTMSSASRLSFSTPTSRGGGLGAGRWGNPNALLYDVRENRCKTAVTAVYKGSASHAPAAFLRSYDSRKEPAPEFECTIWQAGRATSATGLAFKPIRIGQSVFIDEGNGKFNPAPQVLDEAAINEYPGREVGVFVSIGTGKRPGGTDSTKQEWWESFVGGTMGDYADAKRRLLSKIEGCEDTHQYMLHEHLGKRQVDPQNYYRLNVEVGVGEFGMNEWNRLSDISTNTRMYLGRNEVQSINQGAAVKLARVFKAKARWDRSLAHQTPVDDGNSWQESVFENDTSLPSMPTAVELPADEGFSETRPSSQIQGSPPRSPHMQHSSTHKQAYPHLRAPSAGEKFTVIGQQRISSDEYPQPISTDPYQRPAPLSLPQDGVHHSQRPGHGIESMQQRVSAELPHRPVPPPLPPKTPIGGRDPVQPQTRPGHATVLPYPDFDGPPPPVNMARKPEYIVR